MTTNAKIMVTNAHAHAIAESFRSQLHRLNEIEAPDRAAIATFVRGALDEIAPAPPATPRAPFWRATQSPLVVRAAVKRALERR